MFGRTPRFFVGLSLPISYKILFVIAGLGVVGINYASKHWKELSQHGKAAIAEAYPDLIAGIGDDE